MKNDCFWREKKGKLRMKKKKKIMIYHADKKKRCNFKWLILLMNLKISSKSLRPFESPLKVLSFGANLVFLSFFVKKWH